MSARVSELARLLRSGGQTDEQLAVVLHDAHECDIAAALELLDVRQRARLYRLLGVERLGDVFAYVSDAGKYLRELPQEQAAARVGKSRPAITNALRLLNLPSPPSCAAP